MHSVKSQPLFAPQEEKLTVKQLTKPKKLVDVIKANDYVKRDLGLNAMYVKSSGSVFNVN